MSPPRLALFGSRGQHGVGTHAAEEDEMLWQVPVTTVSQQQAESAAISTRRPSTQVTSISNISRANSVFLRYASDFAQSFSVR